MFNLQDKKITWLCRIHTATRGSGKHATKLLQVLLHF